MTDEELEKNLRVRYATGRVNWIGIGALYHKEIMRFMKVWMQSIVSPVVTVLLFLTVFSLAMGGEGRMLGDMPYMVFLAPGLIIMSMAQSAFANTSTSVMISKVQGNIVDVLMPPISAGEWVFCYAMAGVTRGLIVGVASAFALCFIVEIRLEHIPQILVFSFLGSLMLALAGIIGAIWAERFDHIAAVTNFIITPMTFLSGTFYMIERLPENWQILARLNPFFYMIDGFRYGFLGLADASVWVGILVLSAVNMGLWLVCWGILKTGYKLKA